MVRTARRDIAGAAALFAVAFGARLGLMAFSPGGLAGNLGDDAAAYYAGADALVHGRMPYADYTLLHPPLLILVLTPFALLGVAVGDHVGFELAAVANQLTGAVCAVLVVVLARRYGLRRGPAWVAGVFYAVWYGAALPDMDIRLETLQTLCTVLGLIALTRPGRRAAVLAGVGLGLATASKIWGVAPVAVVGLWLLADRRSRTRALLVVGSAAASFLIVLAPFLITSPGPTWRMIVDDQLGRPSVYAHRLTRATNVHIVDANLGDTPAQAWAVGVAVLVAALLVLAARVRSTRLLLALFVAGVAVVFSAPSYFDHYLALVAAPFAVVVGAAAQSAAHLRGVLRRVSLGLAALAVAGATFVTAVAMTRPQGSGPRRFPTAAVARAIEGTHCPMPDGPVALILTDQLSRTLAQGCPDWVDVTGRVYDVDRSPRGHPYPRVLNPRWQRDLTHYLLSGDVVISFRPGAEPGPALRARLAGLPVLVHRDGVIVRRVRREVADRAP